MRRVKKLHKVVVLLFVAVVLCFPLIALVSPVEARETVTCGRLNNPVTIDGKWSNKDEWVDAFEISIGFLQGSGQAYFKAKHDENYLYALIDFVSDTATQEADTGAVIIDPNNNGGSAPQTDDFLVLGKWNSPTQFFQAIAYGTGTAWGSFVGLTAGFKAASSTNADDDPYSTSSHVIYEFQIPMGKLDPTGNGIYVAAFDREQNKGVWPAGPMEEPSKYNYMKFSAEVVPEFSMAPIVLPLLLASAAIVLQRSRKKLGKKF